MCVCVCVCVCVYEAALAEIEEVPCVCVCVCVCVSEAALAEIEEVRPRPRHRHRHRHRPRRRPNFCTFTCIEVRTLTVCGVLDLHGACRASWVRTIAGAKRRRRWRRVATRPRHLARPPRYP